MIDPNRRRTLVLGWRAACCPRWPASFFSRAVYQVLWLRLLSLTFGVTIYAASTVLAAFMAGLARLAT